MGWIHDPMMSLKQLRIQRNRHVVWPHRQKALLMVEIGRKGEINRVNLPKSRVGDEARIDR